MSTHFRECFAIEKRIETNDLYKEFFNKFKLNTSQNIEPSQNLFCAFTHKSYSHESTMDLPHNERLEFLGDAVLDLIVAQKLLELYPEKSEGEISKLRSAIVNEDTLSKIANHLNLGSFILMGNGELKERGFEKNSILANTYEALLGSLFKCSGLDFVTSFVENSFNTYGTDKDISLWSSELLKEFDAKSMLQEKTMKLFNTIPKYSCELIEKDQLFKVSIEVKGKILDSVINKSKKKGMQLVAKSVIDKNILETIEVNKC